MAEADKLTRIADDIAAQGWSRCQDFLPPEVITELAREARRLWQAGQFKKAGIGRSAGYAVRADIRGDYIRWLNPDSLSPSAQQFWDEIERLRTALNRELFAGLNDFESHFASYPPGTHYEKHVDRFNASDARVISCVLYLNENWRREDGGELRIYPPESREVALCFLPEAGTMVAFKSDTVYHEVLPAVRERLSITGWLRRSDLKTLFDTSNTLSNTLLSQKATQFEDSLPLDAY
jgi:SM-20-related protein